jgi:flagellar hook-length control protein FliK
VSTSPPAATSRRPSAEDGNSAKPSVSPVREPAAVQRDAATTAAALAPSAGAATTAAPAGRATMQAANNARDAGNSLEPTRPTDSAATAAALPLPTAGGTLAGPVHGAGTGPTVAEAHLRVPLDSPDFAPALGGQITVFARDGVQTARLQLNPAEMGPITVQIALDGSAARVDFQADLAGTRTIIEASLPALAGALQDAGMTLAGGGVSQQSSGQRQPSEPPAAAALLGSGEPGAGDNAQSAPALQPARSRGLVDLVA